ncbi:Spermidine/putrescine import ATP-binding protein PotA [Fusobacterium necrogenes]|uniref:Spermidine/putrescine import ATP-binding protein PotA n=1 Tax=Fusobacterium necrogenes TaxID=858 RepID=A0A377GXL8_9FUSO|nr:ABC transporter ATP-binding protein [Fusobacterium necrogenes]STO31512.1 Spermidine/putrescine import ATP-binding protein PotA [Fusobacterium necrogenes]
MLEVKIKEKNYRSFALEGIEFEIEKGEFICLLGKSGSGKSTLLKIVAGLDQDYKGEVNLENEDIESARKSGKISMVFQEDLLLPHLDVFENIAFGLRIAKCNSDEIRRRVEEILKKLELEDKKYKYPNELSGGERQRVSIGRALVTEPKLLLMDEPFSALDYNLKKAMQKLVKNLQKELRVTTLFITHDRDEAFTLGDRLGIMENGKLIALDRGEKLFNCPKTLYVAKVLGIENIFLKEKFEKIFNYKSEVTTKYLGISGQDIKIAENGKTQGKVVDMSFSMGRYIVEIEVKDEKINCITNVRLEIGDMVFIDFEEKNIKGIED